MANRKTHVRLLAAIRLDLAAKLVIEKLLPKREAMDWLKQAEAEFDATWK